MKSRIIAGLLALILGVFGIHRFYLRDIGGGIFYVFLFIITNSFWFPVTWILGIIEGIRLFNMSNQEFDSKYNKNFVDYREIPGRRAENYRNTRDQRVPQKEIQTSGYFLKNPFRKVHWKSTTIMILRVQFQTIQKHWIFLPTIRNCISRLRGLIHLRKIRNWHSDISTQQFSMEWKIPLK